MTSILFFGSSHTYYNAAPQIFRIICEEGGHDVDVHMLIKGGYPLEKFADPTDPYGIKLRELLQTEHFDIIFFQDLAIRPSAMTDVFFQSVRTLGELIAPTGSRVILYQTCARKEGHIELEKYGLTPLSMTEKTAAAYQTIARELNYEVSPLGTAFYDVYKQRPKFDLHNMDGGHPSAHGSYLAALCHYATAFGEDPESVTYKLPQIDEESAKILRRAAHDAIFQK